MDTNKKDEVRNVYSKDEKNKELKLFEKIAAILFFISIGSLIMIFLRISFFIKPMWISFLLAIIMVIIQQIINYINIKKNNSKFFELKTLIYKNDIKSIKQFSFTDFNINSPIRKCPILYYCVLYTDIDPEIVKFLLEQGADPNVKVYDEYLLFHSLKKSNDSVVNLLLEKADTDIWDAEGSRPLHIAVSEGRISAVKKLIEQGVQLTKSKIGTPIHIAKKRDDSEMINLLEEQFAKKDKKIERAKKHVEIKEEKVQDTSDIFYFIKMYPIKSYPYLNMMTGGWIPCSFDVESGNAICIFNDRAKADAFLPAIKKQVTLYRNFEIDTISTKNEFNVLKSINNEYNYIVVNPFIMHGKLFENFKISFKEFLSIYIHA